MGKNLMGKGGDTSTGEGGREILGFLGMIRSLVNPPRGAEERSSCEEKESGLRGTIWAHRAVRIGTRGKREIVIQ